MTSRTISLTAILLPAILASGAGLVQVRKSTQTGPLADRIKPILAKCQVCHSGSAPIAVLDLASRPRALAGGKSGSAINLTDPSRSLLLTQISSNKMPPNSPLSAEEKAVVREWLLAGVPWPDASQTAPQRAGLDWWSLQPVVRRTVPTVKDKAWVQNPIDAF